MLSNTKMGYSSFHVGKYYVSFRRGVEDYKKDITISIDKVFENDSLRISLSDDDDPMFLFILTITRSDYEDLKKQQGLLIDFDNFPSQLIRLLQQCAANNMFLIMQQNNPLQYYFEIVEHNEFKRLIHLSLKTGPATDADVKRHMANKIVFYKESLGTMKKASSSNEIIWNDKCTSMERKIHELTHTINKVEEDKLRREAEFQEALKKEKDRLQEEHLEWQKHIDITSKNQIITIQEKLNRKDNQIEDLNSQCKHFKDNLSLLENQLSEKAQRLMLLEKEVQKSHIEAVTCKAKITALEREILEKDKCIHQIQSKCSDLEKTLTENSVTIKNLNSTVQILKTEKASLEERLALSETLGNKNNEAAHNASDQLLKANQIISKLNSDLLEMKEKLLCRTAIVLEQEKVIESNTQEIHGLKTELCDSNKQRDNLQVEIDKLKEKYDVNEKSLKDKDETIKNNNFVIQWLHKKVEGHRLPTDFAKHANKQGFAATSSTPYFISRDSSVEKFHEISDEIPNFYESPEKSDLEESSKTEVFSRNGRSGLDPKYLRPALDKDEKHAHSNKGIVTEKAGLSIGRGKENKEIDLPKVNYKEKKSGRSVSYRKTPVSAYFP